jgi:hypothetical protein
VRIGRRERCAICGGSGQEEDRPGCGYCKGEGRVLLVWFGLRCVPLWKLAEDPGLREGVGLTEALPCKS